MQPKRQKEELGGNYIVYLFHIWKNVSLLVCLKVEIYYLGIN
jgi:hypothetical protein